MALAREDPPIGVLTPTPPGTYLVHKNHALYRVVRAHRGELLLEDCLYPSLPLHTVKAQDLRDGTWRAVKP